MRDIKHILVATDFGPTSERALEMALDLATRFEARLTLLHSFEAPAYAYPFPIPAGVRESASAALDAAVTAARSRVPATNGVLREGIAWEEIVAAAKDLDADVVIIGSHGLRGFRRLVVGSVAERVVRFSTVPVLVVRPEGASGPADG